MRELPYGVVSDVHLHNWSAFSELLPNGENNRLRHTLDALLQAASLFRQSGARRMYIAGDLFHVRGKISPSVLNPTLKTFEQIVNEIEVRIIPGNHDLESDDSKELTNATQALAALGCKVVTEPTYFEDDDVLMVPWEPSLSKLRDTLSAMSTKHKAEAAIIHAPLNGVIPGIPDHGLEASELGDLGYQLIFCGHYHHHVDFGNGVYSIGATTHQTWSDVDTKAGCLIVTADRQVEHRELDAPKFVAFDDGLSGQAAIDRYAGNYVRVKLGEASESEIQTLRESLTGDYGARGVIIHAQPVRKTVERSATIAAGSSLEASVGEFIRHSETAVDKSALAHECEAILAEADNGEDD